MTLNHSGLHKRKKKGASYSNTGNPNSLNSPQRSPYTTTSTYRKGDHPWVEVIPLIGHSEPDAGDCEGAFTASCLSGSVARFEFVFLSFRPSSQGASRSLTLPGGRRRMENNM